MLLWIFFTVNFMYADTLSALEPGVLAMEMSGYVADGTIKITDGFLLGTAVMFEIPFLMIVLSRVLKYGINRWANIIAAALFIAAQISSLFMGAPSPAYLFFSTVEIAGLLLIIWNAWKWLTLKVSPKNKIKQTPAFTWKWIGEGRVLLKENKNEKLTKIWRHFRAVHGNSTLDGINYLHRYSGLHQHNRFGSEGRHECQQPGGSFFNQPAHVCFLWLFSDCIYTGYIQQIESWRACTYASGSRNWDHLGWLIDRQRYGRECRPRTSVVALNATDPTQAALTWQGIEPAIDGLGNANGEILGGLMTLLISLAALRAGGLPKGVNILGLVVGTVGIISLVPALTGTLGPVFGLGQIIWFIWLGIVLLRSNPGKKATNELLNAV